MANTPTGIARTVGLISMIVFDVALIALMFWQGILFWAWFFVGVTTLVIIYEIVAKITTGKTISTQYKEFAQKHPVWAYTGLALFALSMASLVLHLAVW